MRKICLFITLLLSVQLLGQQRIEIVDIENQAVHDYLEDSETTYVDHPGRRVSVVARYNNVKKYGRKLHWPAGKVVKWTPTAPADSISDIVVTVSEHSDYYTPFTYRPDRNDADSFVIRNLLPVKTYYYKVEELLKNGHVSVMDSGVFRTVGQVRMIQVRGCNNVRDLGGWPTSYGKPVAYGRLYRSGSLDAITRNGRHDFAVNLGVSAELDLRNETHRTRSPLGDSVAYLRLAHGMYTSGMTKRKWVYSKDLRWIIDRLQEGKNVDWHCAIGCDRCGTLSFLIEGLLGMSELDLCRDFELSTFSLPVGHKRARSSIMSMISLVKRFGDPSDLAGCFYRYWLSLGMEPYELDWFIGEMLGIHDVQKLTRPYSSNSESESIGQK